MNTMLSYLKKAFSFTKKAILVFTVYALVIVLFSQFTGSEKTSQSVDPLKKSRQDIYQNIHDPKLNATKEGKVGIAFYRLTLCGLVGEACTDNPANSEKNFDKSMLGGVTNLIGMPYSTPPASGIAWVSQGLQNAGFIPQTYAATGIGFSGIQPVQGLWKIFRDFSYLILVLIIIAIGFMIMFRTKINPQTVISVENSLPRIIIALILITLSYAISGFLIDTMYILIVTGISIVSKVNLGDITTARVPQTQNHFIGAGFGDIWPYQGSAFDVGSAMVEVMPRLIKDIFKGVIAIPFAVIVTNFLNWGIKNFFDLFKNVGIAGGAQILGTGLSGSIQIGSLPGIPAYIVSILIFLFIFPHAAGFIVGIIFSITLLFFLFRIFFLLLTSYIKILLFTIFSPIILLFVALPGRPVFSWWFKNLFAELMTFPIVIVLLLVGRIITLAAADDKLLRMPFLYKVESDPFTALLGAGLTLMIPSLIKSAKQALGAKGIGGLGAGTFFAGIGAIGGGATGLMQKYYYAQHMPGISNLVKRFGPKGKGQAEAARELTLGPEPGSRTSSPR